MKKMLSNMLVLAANGHDRQFDKGGSPYILHPLEVMRLLNTTDEELQCIALGHDLLEDTSVTEAEILHATSQRVLDGIMALTKVKGEPFEEYKKKVMSNPDSIRVKMADLRHNSDITRLKGVTEKDMRRTDKYFRFYDELQKASP